MLDPQPWTTSPSGPRLPDGAPTELGPSLQEIDSFLRLSAVKANALRVFFWITWLILLALVIVT